MEMLTLKQVEQVSGGSWELEAAEGWAGAVLGTGAAIVAGIAGAPIIAGALVVGAAGGGLYALWSVANHVIHIEQK